jgi:uncharacterized MAPEG superfamily protein
MQKDPTNDQPRATRKLIQPIGKRSHTNRPNLSETTLLFISMIVIFQPKFTEK